MTNKLHITHRYYCGFDSIIELPDGKTWDDIEKWHIKWTQFRFKLKGENEWRDPINLDTDLDGDAIDWKWPTSVTVHDCDADGVVDWNAEPLSEIE